MRNQEWIEQTEDGRALGAFRLSEYGWEIAFRGETDGPFSSSDLAIEALKKADRCRAEGIKAHSDERRDCPYEVGSLEAKGWWRGYDFAARACGPAQVSMSF